MTCNFGAESDQFDGSDATHCASAVAGRLVADFCAIRCDRPYLGVALFPELAITRSHLSHCDYLESIRFGVLREYKNLGIGRYAVMFRFAYRINAKALVAVTDLGHERLLRKIGVRTRRYGQSLMLRPDQSERPLQVVAGGIPIGRPKQNGIRDETLAPRSVRISMCCCRRFPHRRQKLRTLVPPPIELQASLRGHGEANARRYATPGVRAV